MIISCKLTTAETISLIAAISAAISAIFSMITAIITGSQNWANIKIDIDNKISTETPQNIYNNTSNIALCCISIHNLSPRPVTVSECFIEVDNKKIHALRQDMNFNVTTKEIGIKLSESTSRMLYKKDEFDYFTRIPLELSPFQSYEAFLFFPDFIQSKSNIISGKIHFTCGKKAKCKKIVIHKLPEID